MQGEVSWVGKLCRHGQTVNSLQILAVISRIQIVPGNDLPNDAGKSDTEPSERGNTSSAGHTYWLSAHADKKLKI